MGRAKKQGMDYFPVDVNLMECTAIKVLTARFGAEGFYTTLPHTAPPKALQVVKQAKWEIQLKFADRRSL